MQINPNRPRLLVPILIILTVILMIVMGASHAGATQPPSEQRLRLTGMCQQEDGDYRFRIRNSLPVEVSVDVFVAGEGLTQTIDAPVGDSLFTSEYRNTTWLEWNGVEPRHSRKYPNTSPCPPDEFYTRQDDSSPAITQTPEQHPAECLHLIVPGRAGNDYTVRWVEPDGGSGVIHNAVVGEYGDVTLVLEPGDYPARGTQAILASDGTAYVPYMYIEVVFSGGVTQVYAVRPSDYETPECDLIDNNAGDFIPRPPHTWETTPQGERITD